MIEIAMESGSARAVRRFEADEVRIGRHAENELTLESSNVSKRHARLVRREGALWLEDLGSTNGTRLEGQALRGAARVAPGAAIEIGEFKLLANALAGVGVESTPEGGEEGRAVEKARSRDTALRRVLHKGLIEALDLRRLDCERMERGEFGKMVGAALDALMEASPEVRALAVEARAALRKELLDEVLGLGPLEALLADEEISEIMVNGAEHLFVERRGRLEPSSVTFSSDDAVRAIIERIVAPLGRRIDESSPLVDARLADGSRVNAIIPPLSLKGPCLTIRKFRREKLAASDLVRFGSISPAMAAFLERCVKARKNILISGGTGSGKTTTLNILSGFIPEGERIITIEDAAELQLAQSHWVRLESRPANAEGKGQISIRELVRNSLRMRPDRVVVGECRSGEALDMLQAMNTGHDGSLTTLHANTPRDALARLETMVMMAGMDLPLRAIREQIASAIDLVVQQSRLSDGSRKVTHISEVTGMESETICLQEIFAFRQEGLEADGRVRGSFAATGFIPKFYEELRGRGVEADLSIFGGGAQSLLPPRQDG